MEDNSKESQCLSKEEILSKSREENKRGDERERQSLFRAAYIASAVGFLLYGIISIVLACLGRQSYEMNIVIFAIVGTMYTIWGIKTTKRKLIFLSCGIICIVASVTALICWILQICGVI